MAFRKKDSRPITVDDQKYYWMAKGDDGYITLSIMSSESGTQTMHCTFDYHQEFIRKIEHGVQIGNQFVITPFTVKQVILFALENDWRPTSPGKPLNFGALDEKIDLRIDKYNEKSLNGKTF